MYPSIFLGVLCTSSVVLASLHPQSHHVGRSVLVGDCSAEAVAAGAGICQQVCPVNQVPQYNGTCACDVPKYRLVKHGVPEVTICQPRCGPGYVLSADFTTCICAPSSYISHNTGKCWTSCPAGTFPQASTIPNSPGSCLSCHSIGVATCLGVGPGFALTCKPDKRGHPYFFDANTSSCVSWKGCSPGTYPLLADPNVCTPCAEGVATCHDAQTALTCEPSYYLFDKQCLSQCPSDTRAILNPEGIPVCRYRRAGAYIPPTGPYPNFERQGCFVDNPGRILPTWINEGQAALSPHDCLAACDAALYNVCGLELGGQCFGLFQQPKKRSFISGLMDGLVSSKGCNYACVADDQYTCGGVWAIEIYASGIQEKRRA